MARKADPLPDVPRVAWTEFVAGWQWRQGEHVSVIGATGSGKTTLQNGILPLRQYVLVVATKPTLRPDPTIAALRRQGYRKVSEVPQAPHLAPRALLWPRFEGPNDQAHQAAVIHKALNTAFADGGWTVAVDEVAYLCRELRLEKSMKTLWQQGRSQGITVVGGSQRPAWVPRDMYSSPTHLFFGRMGDSEDRERIGGIGGVDSKVVRSLILTLRQYEFLYVHSVSGEMAVTRFE